MPLQRRSELQDRTVDQLTIDDEPSFAHVALYADLKEVLRRSGYRFRLLPRGRAPRWDRALFLNLTFWGNRTGGDVLVDGHLPADVVAHVAWHHLAAGALAKSRAVAQSAEALFLGEAIASAFDVYLVGRLLGRAPRSTFLATQVPAMAEAARGAGLSGAHFAAMLRGIARDPERAFADLRELLCDATSALSRCGDASEGLAALGRFDGHRFAPLLHRYELSNWILYARTYASRTPGAGARARSVDRVLRGEEGALPWLASHWIAPALDASGVARA